MTRSDRREDVPEDPGGAARRDDPDSAPEVLQAAGRRLRADPRLALPFVVAGLVAALADVARRRDPIPAVATDVAGPGVTLQFALYPGGAVRTARRLGALVDLRTPYLLYAVGLELVVPLAVGVAGWLAIARARGAGRSRAGLARYLAVVLGATLAGVVLGRSTLDLGGFLLGLLATAALLLAFVRLFVAPALIVDGTGFVRAVRASAAASRGREWGLAGLVAVFAVAYWATAQVPVAGAFASTALVAPVHAVALAVLVERTETAAGTDTRGLAHGGNDGDGDDGGEDDGDGDDGGEDDGGEDGDGIWSGDAVGE